MSYNNSQQFPIYKEHSGIAKRHVIVLLLQTTVACLIIGLNLVIFVVFHCKRLVGKLHTLMKCIAISDSWTGCALFVRFVYDMLDENRRSPKICHIIISLGVIGIMSSLTLVMVLNIVMYATVYEENYVSISQSMATSLKFKVMIASIWLTSAGLGATMYGIHSIKPTVIKECSFVNEHFSAGFMVPILVLLLAESIVMAALQLQTMRLVHKQLSQVHPQHPTVTPNISRNITNSDCTCTTSMGTPCKTNDQQHPSVTVAPRYLIKARKIAYTIGMMSVVSSCCVFPCTIAGILNFIGSSRWSVSDDVVIYTFTLMPVSSLVNMFIYTYRSKDFRSSFTDIFCFYRIREI